MPRHVRGRRTSSFRAPITRPVTCQEAERNPFVRGSAARTNVDHDTWQLGDSANKLSPVDDGEGNASISPKEWVVTLCKNRAFQDSERGANEMIPHRRCDGRRRVTGSLLVMAQIPREFSAFREGELGPKRISSPKDSQWSVWQRRTEPSWTGTTSGIGRVTRPSYRYDANHFEI